MLKRIGFIALIFLGGLAAPVVHADEQTGRPFVVVAGIDKYEDPQIKSRKNAEADAKALFELFTSKDSLGAEADHPKLLLGSSDGDAKATKANILKSLQWLEKSAKKDDLVIFAIFGNGAPLGERSCYFALIRRSRIARRTPSLLAISKRWSMAQASDSSPRWTSISWASMRTNRTRPSRT